MAKLFAPTSYWNLSENAKNEVCNGCGAKGKFDFVPDSIYGLSIKEVCNIHDYMYHIGTTQQDKEVADRVMRNNMIRLINERGGLLKKLRRWRAGTYYVAVDKFGGDAYWAGKNGLNEQEV